MRRLFIFLIALIIVFMGKISVADSDNLWYGFHDPDFTTSIGPNILWPEMPSGPLWQWEEEDFQGPSGPIAFDLFKDMEMLDEEPTADAGPDQTVDEGTLVTLDGSNSSDPDDGIESYQWTQTSGLGVTINNDTLAKATFTAPQVCPGSDPLIFQLEVADTFGKTNTDLCAITITWENESPTANAGPDQTADRGGLVTLDGSHSSDPDDGIASYQWTQTSGLLVTLNNDTASEAFFTIPYNVNPNEILAFELKVTDTYGLTSSDTVEIHVSGKGDGDLTQDGVVDVGDALIALRFALNLEPGHPTADELFHGDVAPLDWNNQPDPDGQITVGDALLILQMALGINNIEDFDIVN